MSGTNTDLHRSTLRIYSSLLDEFNPSLKKLASLGNSYAQAFRAFSLSSEAYFNALSKIGERAFHSSTSRPLGDILLQICENQRRLTTELEGVFRRFSGEVLQEMDSNIQLDIAYISGSRDKYVTEAQKQAAVMDRQMRRASRLDGSEHVQFFRESHGQALKEEERRYRFVAEKHSNLVLSFANIMNKTGGALQLKADAWMEQIGATRRAEAGRQAARDSPMGTKQYRDEPLGQIPSRAPSPQGSIRSSAGSISSSGGGKTMRARVAHQPSGSNPTLLTFARGQIITVMVQQPRNGWLYGRTENNTRQGWFPASYVEGLDDPPGSPSVSHSGRSSTSMSNYEQPRMSSHRSAPAPAPPPAPAPAPAPPPPPPLQSPSSVKKPAQQPATDTPDGRPPPKTENKRPDPHAGKPELFPRGTNPFATVKLKPTNTDDRSAPRLYRR